MRKHVPNLELIEERFWNYIKDTEIYKEYRWAPEFSLYMYPQWWGSTALGFGGIGGQALTQAYTTVIVDEKTKYAGVFFEERLAYAILEPNERFWEDLKNHNMASCSFSHKYIKGETNEKDL